LLPLILVGVSCIAILDLPTRRLDRTKPRLYHNQGVTSILVQSSQGSRQDGVQEARGTCYSNSRSNSSHGYRPRRRSENLGLDPSVPPKTKGLVPEGVPRRKATVCLSLVPESFSNRLPRAYCSNCLHSGCYSSNLHFPYDYTYYRESCYPPAG
jgi:hypothetical protein